MLEIELDEIKSLNDLFYLLDLNESSEFEQLKSSLNVSEPKAVEYLEERTKSMNKLTEEMKKEKKYNKKLISNLTGKTSAAPTSVAAAGGKKVKLEKNGKVSKTAKGGSTSKAGRASERNQRLDSSLKIKKKNQSKHF